MLLYRKPFATLPARYRKRLLKRFFKGQTVAHKHPSDWRNEKKFRAKPRGRVIGLGPANRRQRRDAHS